MTNAKGNLEWDSTTKKPEKKVNMKNMPNMFVTLYNKSRNQYSTISLREQRGSI